MGCWRNEKRRKYTHVMGRLMQLPSLLRAMTRYVRWWYGALRLTLSNQAPALAEKPIFRNCLVAMRPKTTRKDLPSRHNIEVYIHNEFVDWLKILKAEILVSNKTAFLYLYSSS